MQKRILFLTLTAGAGVLFIGGIYYLAIFLPQKQKISMDLAKLELEARIAQEKTEQLKIEQADKIREDDKQRAEEEKQEQIATEANRAAELKKKQQTINKCLANANAFYNEKVAKIDLNASNTDSTFDFLNANRIQARNECYK